MNKLLTIIMLLFTIQLLQAAENKIYKINYIVEPKDTLATIYKRFVHLDSVITKKTPMTQRTLKSNPHVKNWNKLVPGTNVTLYITYEYMDLDKYEVYLEKSKKAYEKLDFEESENTPKGQLLQGLKASFYYMASYGRFTQEDPKRANVTFYQNSPITVGSSFSYYPKASNWSFAWSAYLSYLIATANNLDSSNVSVPPEIGLTFYNEYRFVNKNFTGYFGLDAEQFSTFNMGGIQNDRKILLDQNTALYATIGLSKAVQIFKKPYFTKFSFSRSVTTSIKSNPDGIPSESGYEGYKFLWYLNKKVNQKLYLHSLFKYHTMDGPSKLTTLRIGLGIGYILF